MSSLALVLHAHLPFVRHPEHDEFLEEDWLFEAITESYIPLIAMMERLVNDGVPFKLTLSITPPLCAMLQDSLLSERYVRHLDRSIDLASREVARNRNDEQRRALAQFYVDLFSECRRRFVDEWKCDLLGAFRQLRDAGVLEIIASAATHGLLPLLQSSPQAVRAQILIGRDIYRENFEREPGGFWLPECAYAPPLDSILQEANLRWFILDAHGLLFAKPRPRRAIFAPCYTAAGPAAFARDRDSSRQVWSAQEGYPGDPAYRDFYRDIGFDLPVDYLFPHSNGERVRKFTGIKYHRITGHKIDKELYNRDWAKKVAETHANHFFESRSTQLKELRALGLDPIVVAPFDAELFGHWWFEGPRFLEFFIRRVAQDRHKDFSLTTPSEFLASHPTQQIVEPAASSWGEKGYLGVWLDESNAWIYPHLHAAARRMTETARAYSENPPPLAERVLKQLARELLLAQSSDWAFLIKTGTAREYATKRAKDHLLRFNRLHDQLNAGEVDEKFLGDCEWRDNLFPNVNWRYYI
ncbi:MAG: 1,4-alpha-glucan branching enzyme [Verrucomicrobiota bacterium]|jgi:1,4-alpha-glucan branching enzyme